MSTPPAKTRSERKREAILAAAIEEFQSAGYRDTSMDRIAERAEVSKRTVYNHFPSKEALFRAVTADLIDQVRQAMTVSYDAERPLRDQLLELAHHEVEAFSARGFLATTRAILAEAVRNPDLVREAFADAAHGDSPVSAWVIAATNDGRLVVEDPALAAEQLAALLKGPLFWPAALGLTPPPRRKERARVIEAAVEMFLATYEAEA